MSKAEQLTQKYTKEQLWKIFDALPGSVKGVILAPKTLEITDAIAKENDISDKAGKLTRYIDLILAGIIPITLFREALEEELGLDEEHARKIAQDVRDKIFMSVKDELRKIHNLG